jgi:MoxR-like ATPase
MHSPLPPGVPPGPPGTPPPPPPQQHPPAQPAQGQAQAIPPAQQAQRERIAHVGQQFRTVMQNVERVILGKNDVISRVLAAMCAGGHVLLLDVPGVGKTMLARSIAASIHCSFKRIQFTPDLLPLDITGNNVFNLRKKAFEFVPGPVFANLLLADEINRATPKTQAALLEVMAEGQVTVDGTTHVLPQPFLVIATMNPLEHDGTFPLPAAQLDRFSIRISMGFPPPDAEMRMLDVHIGKDVAIGALAPVLGAQEFLSWQQLLPSIYVAEAVKRYAVNVVTAMRQDSACLTPPSPRATLMWLRMAMALAMLDGRDHAVPTDLQRSAVDVLSHRVVVSGQRSGAGYVDHIVRQVPVGR